MTVKTQSAEATPTVPDKRKAAVCGLYCPACTLYIGTQEDPARLARSAQRFGRPVTDVACDGCRAERRSWYCRECAFVDCAARQGVEFCGECARYPCPELQKFQAERPHRAELWEAQARIREVGFEQWYQEAARRYSCPDCNTMNSAYDLACRKCGRTPSNDYVAKHRQVLEAFSSPKPGQ